MDVLTIWLAARHREPWPYYALMATIGAVLGGYITYSLARKGGKQAMEHRLSKRRAAKVYKRFERWGFGAIAIPALLPPPFPFVPFLLAAGAMQYSRKKFLGALVLGRGVRYSIAAYLGVLYGNHIVRFFCPVQQTGCGHTDRLGGRRRNSYADPVSSLQVRIQLPTNSARLFPLCTFVSSVVKAFKGVNHTGHKGTQRKRLAQFGASAAAPLQLFLRS